MKQIIYTKPTPQGLIKGVLRVVGKYVFLKKNNNLTETNQLIDAYRKKGAIVKDARTWIQIDFIKENEVIRLGEKEVDLNETTKEELENFIYEFYLNQYKKKGFIIQETQDEKSI